jgi:hypothetical protein
VISGETVKFYALRANAGGSQVALLAFAAMILLADWFTFKGVVGQALATGYPTAQAVVTRSKLCERRGSKGGKTYSLDLAYEYVVDGNRYTGTRRRYYEFATSNRQFWEQVQAEFPVGRQVTVAYSPSDPTDAILTPGIQTTDWVRALVTLSLTVLLIGAWRIAKDSRAEFDPTDPRCVDQTETGWIARLPETSHLRVFAVVACGVAALGGFLLFIQSGNQLESVGAVATGAIAAGAAAAAIFARYPVLVADVEAEELILPEKWFRGSVRVPFAGISDVSVRVEERSLGRGKKLEVYCCVLSWADDNDVHLTKLETFLKRRAAEGLREWVKVATGLVAPDEAGGSSEDAEGIPSDTPIR